MNSIPSCITFYGSWILVQHILEGFLVYKKTQSISMVLFYAVNSWINQFCDHGTKTKVSLCLPVEIPHQKKLNYKRDYKSEIGRLHKNSKLHIHFSKHNFKRFPIGKRSSNNFSQIETHHNSSNRIRSPRKSISRNHPDDWFEHFFRAIRSQRPFIRSTVDPVNGDKSTVASSMAFCAEHHTMARPPKKFTYAYKKREPLRKSL